MTLRNLLITNHSTAAPVPSAVERKPVVQIVLIGIIHILQSHLKPVRYILRINILIDVQRILPRNEIRSTVLSRLVPLIVNIIGIHSQVRVLTDLIDGIYRNRMYVVPQIKLLIHRWIARLLHSRQPLCLPAHTHRRLQLSCNILSGIVRLISHNGLELLAEKHRSHFSVPQNRLITSSGLDHTVPGTSRTRLQNQIDSSPVRSHPVLQYLDRLMVLIHLHLCNVAGLNAIRCNSILTAQHIQALHIELVDSLSLILDLSAWGDLDSRQLLQHITDTPVS